MSAATDDKNDMASLVARARDGDRAAADVLIHAIQPTIYRLAQRFLMVPHGSSRRRRCDPGYPAEDYHATRSVRWPESIPDVGVRGGEQSSAGSEEAAERAVDEF